MSACPDVLTRFLGRELPGGCVGKVRRIEVGDELLLTEVERQGLEGSAAVVRRASGAGRQLARELCQEVGVAVEHIPRSRDRAPRWPPGVVGSIAHDAEYVAVVLAVKCDVKGLGVDLEPAEELPEGVAAMVGSANERELFRELGAVDKAIFCVKEAVFKAAYPLDGMFLDFHDVTLSARDRRAVTCYGRQLEWRMLMSPRVVAIAWCV